MLDDLLPYLLGTLLAAEISKEYDDMDGIHFRILLPQTFQFNFIRFKLGFKHWIVVFLFSKHCCSFTFQTVSTYCQNHDMDIAL
jgi:hypothetical protein